MALLSFRGTPSINFLRFQWLPIFLLAAMVVLVSSSLFIRGVNFGIDFKGGLVMEVQLPKSTDINALRSTLKKTLKKDVSLQTLGTSEEIFLIRTENTVDQPQMLAAVKQVLGPQALYRRVDSIGPKVGHELIRNGLLAIFWALLSVMTYVWFRFQWQFSLCAGLALIHDCLSIVAFYSLFGIELTENAIVALLITAAYSINDTVVIFDRLRESLGKSLDQPFSLILNKSINETLSRTLFTSFTTLLALAMLCLYGGEVIASFSLPILIGVTFGTFSSIVIAGPLLQWLPLGNRGARP